MESQRLKRYSVSSGALGKPRVNDSHAESPMLVFQMCHCDPVDPASQCTHLL